MIHSVDQSTRKAEDDGDLGLNVPPFLWLDLHHGNLIYATCVTTLLFKKWVRDCVFLSSNQSICHTVKQMVLGQLI